MDIIQSANFNTQEFQIKEVDIFGSPQSTADPYYPPEHCGFSYQDITPQQPVPATGFPQKNLRNAPDWIEYEISLYTSDRWFLQYAPIRVAAEKYLNKIKNRGGFHPMLTSRWILRLLYCYKQTNNNVFLHKSKSVTSELLDRSTEYNGSLFFPYLFDYHNFDRVFSSPWYSGMAQGVALSALSRLSTVNEKKKYRQYADQIFNSFQIPKNTKGPWVALVDDNNFYWIEEYPMNHPSHVLNGFITAIWGIYDYWLLTKRQVAYDILIGSLTTLEKNIYKFRNIDNTSWYSIYPKSPASDKYHCIHSFQSQILAKISECDLFRRFYRDIQSDYDIDPEGILRSPEWRCLNEK